MFQRKTALIGALILGVAMLGATASPASAKPATRKVGNPATCKGATYPTINAAVAAANPGDTIKVCPGTYNENVAVNKPLKFLGAKAGKDGRNRKASAKESVVKNASGADFELTGAANNVTIDGFTLSGVDANSTDNGISAFQGTSGLVVVNNIIAGNCNGMNFQNPNASLHAQIRHNAFRNNTAGSGTLGPQCGTGVFISNGPANNTAITENNFTGHNSGQTAINFAGSSANPSVKLSVTHNNSVDDSTFVVATNSNGAVIAHNKVTVKTPFANQGTGILDFGSNANLSITDNQINGGSGTGTSGINIRALSGTPSTNTRATNNHVNNRYNGVRLTDAATSDTVSGNHIAGSHNDGIFMESGGSNKFLNNEVKNSTVHDCQDLTIGVGTAGTANQWKGNSGASNNSAPAAICPKK
jgi:parallel beta-helix repeat protein